MLIDTLRADRALTVVRAARIDDPPSLCAALTAGGIRAVEFTFTTPGVERVIAQAAASAREHGALVGAGTVRNRADAEAAIEAGAAFLVTPGIDQGVSDAAREASVPVLLGAFTPTEAMRALDLGAAAVKIFPASRLGAGYLRDLDGPFPGARWIPSGGLTALNAAEWTRAGALAATAGSSVVPAQDVEGEAWESITRKAREFGEAARSGAASCSPTTGPA